MKTNLLKTGARAILTTTMLAFCTASASTVVYDNTVNFLGLTYSPGNGIEFGDEVFLSGGPNFTITEFTFETFVGLNADGDEKVKIRFLLNDGTELGPARFAPKTQLYESGFLNLSTDFQATTISGISAPLPPGVDHFTWTAEFSGIDLDEQVGLTLYHPPVVGSSYTDFWMKENGAWDTLLIHDGTPASFGALISSVPDTGSTAIFFALALTSLAALRRRIAPV